MFHTHPTSKKDRLSGTASVKGRNKKDKNALGVGKTEEYKLNNVEGLNLKIETFYSGWEDYPTSDYDRVLVFRGSSLGFASINGKEYRLEEGVVLEVPKGTTLRISGQLSFYCIESV